MLSQTNAEYSPKCLEGDTIFCGHGDQGPEDPGNQGPKLACTVHVRTVALSLSQRTFHACICVSNVMEWAIEFI